MLPFCSFLLESRVSSQTVHYYHFALKYAPNTHSEMKCFSVFTEYLLDSALTHFFISLNTAAFLKQPVAEWVQHEMLAGNHSPLATRADNLTLTCQQWAPSSSLCCSSSREHMGKACSILACHPLRNLCLGRELMTSSKGTLFTSIFSFLKGPNTNTACQVRSPFLP